MIEVAISKCEVDFPAAKPTVVAIPKPQFRFDPFSMFPMFATETWNDRQCQLRWGHSSTSYPIGVNDASINLQPSSMCCQGLRYSCYRFLMPAKPEATPKQQVTLTIRIDENLHREIRVYAAQQGMTIRGVLLKGFESLKKQTKAR